MHIHSLDPFRKLLEMSQHLPSTSNNSHRQPRQPRHLDAKCSDQQAHRPGTEQRRCRAPLLDDDMDVLQPRERRRERGELVVEVRAFTASWMCLATARAIANPSKVDVPRPISSSNTSEYGVAARRMWLVSVTVSRP